MGLASSDHAAMARLEAMALTEWALSGEPRAETAYRMMEVALRILAETDMPDSITVPIMARRLHELADRLDL